MNTKRSEAKSFSRHRAAHTETNLKSGCLALAGSSPQRLTKHFREVVGVVNGEQYDTAFVS